MDYLVGKNGPLYSSVDLGAKALKRKVGTGAEFLKELMALPGIKANEIHERKLGELMGLPKMTHEQFLSELQKRPLASLKETVLNNEPSSIAPTQYGTSKLTLPNGSNYREVLYQLPHFEGERELQELKHAYENGEYYNWSDKPEREAEQLWQRIQDLEREKKATGIDPRDQYEEPHWNFGQDDTPFPNVMAHLRLSDRPDPNGGKALHAEEIQSQWHQEGRKEGYSNPAKIRSTLEDIENYKQGALNRFKERLINENTQDGMDPIKAEKLANEIAKTAPFNNVVDYLDERKTFRDLISKHDAEVKAGHVPDAPYKKNWHELMLKKLLHEGATKGYSGLMITPGDVQNDRYNLAKYINELHYNGRDFKAYDHNGNSVFEQTGVAPQDIERMVGKEVAEKLMAQEPTNGTLRSLVGQDIHVGGEGMRGFYDKIVPDYLNKFGKKYGVKVSQVPISTPKGQLSISDAMNRAGLNENQWLDLHPDQRMALLDKYEQEANQAQTMVHHFPITEEMRQDITNNGLPTYKDGGETYYHGSTEDIHEFHPSKIGTFITLDPEEAHRFAMLKNQRAGRPMHKDVAIYPVKADIKNPFDSTNPEHLSRLHRLARQVMPNNSLIHDIIGGMLEGQQKGYGNESNWSYMEDPDIQKLIKAMGHDAYTTTEGGKTNMAVYDPKSLKFKLSMAHGGSVPHLAIGGQGPRNWAKGSVDEFISPLILNHNDPEEWQQIAEDPSSSEHVRGTALLMRKEALNKMALNAWVKSNLANYIKKQMATENDPVRNLIDQGISHADFIGRFNHTPATRRATEAHRQENMGKQYAKTVAGSTYEDLADRALEALKVKDLINSKNYSEPWMQKADPETTIIRNRHHYTNGAFTSLMGFDHLIDVLKQDLNEDRIRPDQLSKVSIEQAVRRAHEYNEERRKTMEKAALKATEGMPVHKDYGNGYKWLELTLPEPKMPEGASMKYDPEADLWGIHTPEGKALSLGASKYQALNLFDRKNRRKQLENALKYEGDIMGHCVGGYGDDVLEGKSRIFSLRDQNNEPHVTIETKPGFSKLGLMTDNDILSQYPEIWQHRLDYAKAPMSETSNIGGGLAGWIERNRPEVVNQYPHLFEKTPRIAQIKGKQNSKPNPQYIPYVQDFVKNGNWSDVQDLENADMVHHNGQIMTINERDKPMVEDMANQLRPQGLKKGGQPTQAEMAAELYKKNLDEFLKHSKEKGVMYHGTLADFNQFRPNTRGAHFVSPSPDFASSFILGDTPHIDDLDSDEKHLFEGANVMPVHVNATNPFDYENKKHVNDLAVKLSLGKTGQDAIKTGHWESLENRTAMKAIKDLGHDSMYVNENGAKNLAVFSPNQIKSAIGNRGTFDPNNPDITMSVGGLAHTKVIK